VITDKRVYRMFREYAVERIAAQLPRDDLLIVHGGGSFGHHLAKEFAITSGFEDRKREGFAKIGFDMEDLNLRILNILLERKIPAVSIPPHSFFIYGEEPRMDVFRKAVELGFAPVTYGDIIFDKEQGINICSGDYLMYHLAKEFRPEKTIFLTDVDGIYDRDPGQEGAKLIRHLERDVEPSTAIKVDDVTGGIAYKIKMMRKIADYSKVYVINGFHPERINKVMNDEEFIGTVVE